jgi:hypothetical protein
MRQSKAPVRRNEIVMKSVTDCLPQIQQAGLGLNLETTR